MREHLSLCRINNNSSCHLLNTYYVLDSGQACYAVVPPSNHHRHSVRKVLLPSLVINEEIEALKGNLPVSGRARLYTS